MKDFELDKNDRVIIGKDDKGYNIFLHKCINCGNRIESINHTKEFCTNECKVNYKSKEKEYAIEHKKEINNEIITFIKNNNRFPHGIDFKKFKKMETYIKYIHFLYEDYRKIPNALKENYNNGEFFILGECKNCKKLIDITYLHTESHYCKDDVCIVKFNPIVVESNINIKKSITRNFSCPICGELIDHFKNTKYCSKRCYGIFIKYNYNKHIYQDDDDFEYLKEYEYKYNKICVYCNSEFKTNQDKQQHCSNECVERHKSGYTSLLHKPLPYEYKGDINYNKLNKREVDNLLEGYKQKFKVVNNGLNNWLLGGFTDRLKDVIRSRDNHRCYICSKNNDLHVHHIIPRVNGGTHHPDNLITLCSGCHVIIERCSEDEAVKRCTKRAIENI